MVGTSHGSVEIVITNLAKSQHRRVLRSGPFCETSHFIVLEEVLYIVASVGDML
jgi:hypothetical protein